MISYVRWAASTSKGLKKARIVYKKLAKNYVVSSASFEAWILLEKDCNSPSAQKQVEWLHEAAIRANPSGTEVYISYIKDLMRAHQPQKAMEVYWRGTRNVSNHEGFEVQYRKLKDSFEEGMDVEGGDPSNIDEASVEEVSMGREDDADIED